MQMKYFKNKPDKDMKTLANGMGIALLVTEEKLLSKGWEGQAKGLMQVLFELRYIDTTKKVNKFYTIAGTKDPFGDLIPGSRCQ